MNYVVAACRNTLQLYRKSTEEWGTWIPLIREPRRTSEGRVVHRQVSALPGYIFIPEHNWRAMPRHIPDEFALRAMRYHPNGDPWTVPTQELVDMQDTINKLYHTPRSGSRSTEPLYQDLPVGCSVQLTAAPFTGLVGTVDKVRSATARVLIGTKFVTVGRAFLLRTS